jgi:hypothetical protein
MRKAVRMCDPIGRAKTHAATRLRLVRAVTALVVAAVVTAGAAPGGATVKGQVIRNGAGVTGAQVVIESAADSAYGHSVRTGRDGTFTFPDAPPGEVTLKVYDAQDTLVVLATAVVERDGQVLDLQLEIP